MALMEVVVWILGPDYRRVAEICFVTGGGKAFSQLFLSLFLHG